MLLDGKIRRGRHGTTIVIFSVVAWKHSPFKIVDDNRNLQSCCNDVFAVEDVPTIASYSVAAWKGGEGRFYRVLNT